MAKSAAGVMFAADENLNGRLFRAIVRKFADVDIIRVQDTDIDGAPDEELLEWTAEQQRILLTHDVRSVCVSKVGSCAPR